MLKRKFRLPKNFFKNEKLFKSSFFDLKVARNGKNLSRFAFVISKKVKKSAVARNRIKRKFRGCIENNFKNIKTGYDFLFIIRKGILEKNYCKEILTLLNKEKII